MANITAVKNYQYDANGNLLTDGKTTYTYDYQNRIVSTATGATGASTVSAYSYDFQGQRDKSVVTITTTDAATGNVTIKAITTYTPTSYYSSSVTTTTVKSKTGTVLSATTAPAEITKHIFANGRMLATVRGTGATAKAYVTLTDSLNGSTVVLDSNNAVVETTDYYPFGAIRFDNQVNSYNEKRKYIGQEYDAETSLSYLNARYYNGTIGRFITQDPVFWGNQNLSDPQSLNAYSYANNNPITLSDPSGLMTLAEIQTQIDSIKSQIGTLTKAVGDYTAQAGKAVITVASNTAKAVYNIGAYSSAYIDSRYAELKAAPNPTPQELAMSFSGGGMAGVTKKAVPLAAEKMGVLGYKSFSAFKRVAGAAGEGKQWHHIVEQGGKNAEQFAAERLHNAENLVNIATEIHQKISAYYSSGGYRNFVQSLSFEEQLQIGKEILNMFLGK